MTGLLGVVVDAWDEVRVHRSRVVLSLIGILLAVFAMTVTTAAGMIFGQIVRESTQKAVGRDATLTLFVTSNSGDSAAVGPFYDSLIKRYGVKYNSRVVSGNLPGTGDQTDGSSPADELPEAVTQPWQVTALDPGYQVIHRVNVVNGRWLTAQDAQIMAPSVVVNETAMQALGQDPQRPLPFTTALPGDNRRQVVVVGVTKRDEYSPAAYALIADAPDLIPTLDTNQGSLELWVPPERAEELRTEIGRLISAAGMSGEASPGFAGDFDIVLIGLQGLILVLALFALFLGALGVLNVGVVTVRQRVREIGVRRALGASSLRIFCAVMLESVLATMLAGLLGIALAIALVNNFPYELLPDEIRPADAVPFPVAAAIQAFVAATLVGAFVGLVPATIAVRAKVIDAIRF